MRWLIVPTIFGALVIYNVILSCDGEVSCLLPYFLYMVDSMKRIASVGLAQARPNNRPNYSKSSSISSHHSSITTYVTVLGS